jgi:hypothetical protein
LQFFCPSSGVFYCTFGTGVRHAGLITYTSAECTVENSWWWAEELPETCWVSWQTKFGKLVRLLVLLKRTLEGDLFVLILWY